MDLGKLISENETPSSRTTPEGGGSWILPIKPGGGITLDPDDLYKHPQVHYE